MSVKTFGRFDPWPPPPGRPAANVKFSIWLTIIAALQLVGNQAMTQPHCDVVQIAKAYVEIHFPFIDVAADHRRAVTSQLGNHLQVTFTFDPPATYLGFVPEITVDPRTCQVVSAKVWQ